MKYQRIVLKLSGEALGPQDGRLLSAESVQSLVEQLAELVRLGVQIAIVPGGGNVFRGRDLSQEAKRLGIRAVTADHIGMLATVMNALLLRDTLADANLKCTVFSPHKMSGLTHGYSRYDALEALKAGSVVVCAGGTGNPLVTTDTAAALRAIELSSEVILKASTVDGVYDQDPATIANAHKFETLGFDEALSRGIKVMDMFAFSLCQENNVPIIVYDHNSPNALIRITEGEKLGTLIDNTTEGT